MNLQCQDRIRVDCLRILNGRAKELEPLRQSKLVIVGGTGFVGTWIAEMIVALNDEINLELSCPLYRGAPINLQVDCRIWQIERMFV